jgi:mannosyltransferase
MTDSRAWRWMAFILGTGLALRLIGLASRPIWYDEAFSLLLSRRSWEDIVQGTAADTMPPLYYFLLKVWQSLGSGVAFDRLLNVLLGLTLIAVVFLWVKELLGLEQGLWAAAFVAVSPLVVYHAQELRMYSLLTLAVMVNWYAFTHLHLRRFEIRGHVAWWVLYIASGAAAMYSHNLAIFSLLAPDALLLFRREFGGLRRVVISQGLVVAVSLPWLVIVPQQIGKIQAAFWTPRPGLLEIVQSLLEAHTFLPLPGAWIAPAVLAVFLVLAFSSLELARSRPLGPPREWLLVSCLLPPLLLFILSYIMRPVFVPRAFLPSILAYYALVAWVAVGARSAWVGRGVAVVLVAVSLAGLWQQDTFESFPRSPFDQAATWLESQVQSGDRVVHDNKLSYFPMEVYAPGLPMTFLPDPPGSHNDTLAPATEDALDLHPARDIETAAQGSTRIWFVTFQRALDEYAAMGLPEHPTLAWLDDHYQRQNQVSFNDLLVFQYGSRP